jgi:steroid 5-alpha reductase family enzyme
VTIATFIAVVALLSASLSGVMAVAWLVQQRTGNSGWVDTIWTFGLGLVGALAALAPIGPQPWPMQRQILVAIFLSIWALRLGVHIATRTAGITDDPRYAELIRQWGPDSRRQMFWLLQKQALVSIPLATSIFLAAHNPTAVTRAQDMLAIALLAIAIAGEAVADRELRRFREDPANRGRVCDRGLWRFSRHPNYFFEWLGWCAYPLLAIDVGGSYPLGWVALAGPACMYWLLAYVSGIPPLEAHMVRSRGAAYRAYQARTSAFFPSPPTSSPATQAGA